MERLHLMPHPGLPSQAASPLQITSRMVANLVNASSQAGQVRGRGCLLARRTHSVSVTTRIIVLE